MDFFIVCRLAEVVEGTKGLLRKVCIWTKILSPNMRYFVAISRFVAIYALDQHFVLPLITCQDESPHF